MEPIQIGTWNLEYPNNTETKEIAEQYNAGD
jgi:hypothetical protein